MAMCVDCGHGRLAHIGGSCMYCGCRASTFHTETGVLAPGSGRRNARQPSDVPRAQVGPRTIPGVRPTDALRSEHRELIEFIRTEMDTDAARRFGSGLAAHHGIAFSPVHLQVAIKELVKQLAPHVADRYLAELRRRQAAGESLVR